MGPNPRLSAFVVTYNRAGLLAVCLRAARFVDELIVIDKFSTDDTESVARGLADAYYRVPWSPIVEDTRATALAWCTGDLIICLDDDEILSADCATVFRTVIAAPDADVYDVPIKRYLSVGTTREPTTGRVRSCLFRRGAVTYVPVVHDGTIVSGRRQTLPLDGPSFIPHTHARDRRDLHREDEPLHQRRQPPGSLANGIARRLCVRPAPLLARPSR